MWPQTGGSYKSLLTQIPFSYLRGRWRFLRKHSASSLMLGAACAVIVFSHRHVSDPPPFPLDLTTITTFLAQTPFDNYRANRQQQFLRYADANVRDSLHQAIATNPYDASVFFHAFLDRSLYLRFIGKPESSQVYENVAGEMAQVFAEQYGDRFFIQRFEQLTHLKKSSPKDLNNWIIARTAFMRGIGSDTSRTRIIFNLRCLEYAHAQFQRLGDLKQAADNLWWLCTYHLRVVDDKSQIYDLAQQWLHFSRDIGYRDNELEALLIMAEIYDTRRQSDSSNICIEQAVRLAEQIKKPYALASLWDVKLGDAILRNDIRAALSFLSEQFRLIQKTRYRALKAETHAKAAQIYHVLADYNRTLAHLDTAITLKRDLSEFADLPSLWLHQAKVHLELGDWQHALALADSALQGYEGLQNISRKAGTLGLIGIIHLWRKNFQQARAYQRQGHAALGTRRAHIVQADLWNNLGEIARQDSSWREAEQAYVAALNMGENAQYNPARAKAWLGLGYISLQQQQTDSALAQFQRAHRLAEGAVQRELIWNCHFGLAQAYTNAGHLAAARLHYDSTIAALEHIRNSVSRLDFNMNYFSTVQRVFDSALGFALERAGDGHLALQYMEKAKARNTVDLLFRQIANTGGLLNDQIAPSDSSFFQPHANPVDVQNLLDDSTAILAYRVMQSKLTIAVVNRSDAEVVQVAIPSAKLRQKVQNFRRTLGIDDRDDFRKRLRSDFHALRAETEHESAGLYQWMIAPVEHALRQARTLYIVPDDILYYLPFAALKDEHSKNLLLEKFDLAFAPSITALQLMLKRSTPFEFRAEGPALLIAMASPSIPNAVPEVKAVARFFKNAAPIIATHLTRAQLTGLLDRFKGIVHLALHADVDDSRPLHSFLILDERRSNRSQRSAEVKQLMLQGLRYSPARRPRDDAGILRAADILDLDLQGQQLAVLSACKTALGQNLSGEGMMGLTQAFLCAGTQRLLTSLWDVDDHSTSELMAKFYRHLQHGETPARALRTAQLEMIEILQARRSLPYAFPYFWAAFVLTGRGN